MNETIKEAQQRIIEEVESKLPHFVDATQSDKGDTVLLHQDAYAVDYEEEEILLLGMAVKYAGMHGKAVQIIGNNKWKIEKDEEA